jgi:hypothetical protein
VLKQTIPTTVAVFVLALALGCVRDVETESAASFNLQSGQTWAWVPEAVESWQGYEGEARHARLHTHEAYVEERQENRELREERREEPVGPERRAERRRDDELVYDGNAPAIYAGAEGRTLKREHKHIQESIAGELSSQGLEHSESSYPTYYVAYYLFSGGHPVAPHGYAAYEGRTDAWDARFDEDTLLIDIVDPATGKLLWAGSGIGNTRAGGNDEDRMRGVKEAVRHIMRDL